VAHVKLSEFFKLSRVVLGWHMLVSSTLYGDSTSVVWP
jgi:hypothetical protein